jgi:hypothetical protein
MNDIRILATLASALASAIITGGVVLLFGYGDLIGQLA